jgi:hypothetical protein
MFRYLKWKYIEWKDGNKELSYRIDFRSHPKARDTNYNRYAAMVYSIKCLTSVGAISAGTMIETDEDGKWIEFTFKRKYFKDVMEVQRKVV